MSVLPTTIPENDERVQHSLRPLVEAAEGKAVFLVDGDRTLTPGDTSREFLAEAGIDPLLIKTRFQRDGYVFESFRFHAEMHLQLGAGVFAELSPRIAGRTDLYRGAAEFLRDATQRAFVVVVSAGIPRIWRSLLDLHGLNTLPVFGGIDPANPFVFGRREKGLVADLIRTRASAVVAVGDSDVDTEMMLRADHAVVVVNHRRNVDLVPHLRGHPALWQVVAQGVPHAGIPTMTFDRLAHIVG